MKEESEKIFCRLCGKFRPKEEIHPIDLAKFGNGMIKYDGCDECQKIIHNMNVLIIETIKKVEGKKEETKIIEPFPGMMLKREPI